MSSRWHTMDKTKETEEIFFIQDTGLECGHQAGSKVAWTLEGGSGPGFQVDMGRLGGVGFSDGLGRLAQQQRGWRLRPLAVPWRQSVPVVQVLPVPASQLPHLPVQPQPRHPDLTRRRGQPHLVRRLVKMIREITATTGVYFYMSDAQDGSSSTNWVSQAAWLHGRLNALVECT